MPGRTFVTHPKWIMLWASFIALGWLLPIHYVPWSSFHHDAWCAAASALAAAALVWRAKGPWPVPKVGLALGLLVLVPLLQWISGQIPLVGAATMAVAYLLGFFLVVWCGARWEAAAPGHLLDGLFLALGLAAVASVWIQLRQWLQLDTGWEWWSMGGPVARPAANIAQPNQAATFLCLGLGAVAWGAWRGQIRWSAGLFAAAYLLFGVALTGSRTAWLGLALVVLAVWQWRRLWPDARTPWFVAGLFLFLVFCIGFQTWLPTGQLSSSGVLGTDSARQRLDIWSITMDSVALSPWTGYGWNQTALAEMRALDARAEGFTFFNSAHNLFLDMVLWCGIPLGGLLSLAILAWLGRRFLAVKRPDQAILLLLVLLVFNHSMLEYPLYYAYLLLPLGWLIGAMEVRMGGPATTWFQVPRALVIALYLAACALLGLIIADYFPIELAHRSLKLERAHIQTEPWTTPNALVLSHLSDYLEMLRAAPTKRLSDAELLHREHLTEMLPDGYAMFYLAAAEALSQRPDQATLWMRRFCKLKPPGVCAAAANDWAESGKNHPEMAAIPWPADALSSSRE
jgi:O-antigen ligase